MICSKCHAVFDVPANFCPHCGASLKRGGGKILTVTAILVLAMIMGAYGYVQLQYGRWREIVRQPPANQSQGFAMDRRFDDRPPEIGPAFEAQPLNIDQAELILADINGRRILSAPIVLLAPGWFAFPARHGIGAYTWQVELPSGRRLEVRGGILHNADPVGLWQLPAAVSSDRIELMPWSPERPLTWQPLDGREAGLRVQVRNTENQIDFVRIPFQIDEEGPGVFVQNGRVVGWSFGALLPGGYLWTGNPGNDLTAEFYTDDFYRLTFAGSREEAFLLALANEDLTAFRRLEALAAAHRLEPRLAPSETPAHILPAAIHADMRELIARLGNQDRMADVLELFDTSTVLAVDNPSLAFDLVKIAMDAGAYPYALEVVEALQEINAELPGQPEKLQALQISLYQGWLGRLLAEGDQYTALEIYQDASDRFPQDPGIHLAGVKLALQEQDWALAERRLRSRDYPLEWRDAVSRLQQEISGLKSEEGRIVVRFQPGSRAIPVVARLDRNLNQRFIVDTGASLVTVPTTAVRRLGIDITNDLPRRLFYSATGVQNAVEITLPYIELDGWVVENVRALVVDLPGQPEVGLLGMNYLGNFRMDVNTGEGVLLLEPR
jgi:clan AA aspartic protease (TIGR02281 family)